MAGAAVSAMEDGRPLLPGEATAPEGGGRLRRVVLAALLGASGLAVLAGGLRWRPRAAATSARLPMVVELAAAEEGRGPRASADNLGTVDELYTYGAPGVAHPAIEDRQRPDRCFRGLRSYTEDFLGVARESKQIDAAAIVNRYEHARMPVAALHWGTDSYYEPCPGKVRWPEQGGGIFSEWGLHWEDDYTPRLEHVTVDGQNYSHVDPFAKAYAFVILAYKSYDSTVHAKQAIAKRLPGWKLVAKEVRESGKGTLYDSDPVMLVQQRRSLECALVFTGTNNGGNEITTSTTDFPTRYCGYDAVHAGYRNELWQITKALWPKLRPKLAKCSRVVCVGHSMGGSLCEIFAGCANKKALGDPDFEQQKWVKGVPEEMPEV